MSDMSLPDPDAEAQIVFTPSGRRGRFPVGTAVLDAARALGVDLDSVCGGRGICGRCQVVQSVGEFSKHGLSSRPEHLSEFGAVERRYHEKRSPLDPGRRLGCSAKIQGDLVIDVPPESQVHRQVVRKRAEVHDIRIDPVVRLHYVEVAPPDMHEPIGDLRRVKEMLAQEWELHDLECGIGVLELLPGALRDGRWQVTVAVHEAREIVAVWPGFSRTGFSEPTVDVGSTTIAAHLMRSCQWRGRGLGGVDESPDSLRRGSDESGFIRDDAPRRRAGDDRGGAKGGAGSIIRGGDGGGDRTHSIFWISSGSAIRSCTTSCSASIRWNWGRPPSP